jgi:hypothetical protein
MKRRPQTRGGTILPLLGVCLTGLFAFVALAVDLGMLAVSRTQCQNAADVAALSGTRTLNNTPGVLYNNLPAAVAQAKTAATTNPHMAGTFAVPQITHIEAGQYTYDAADKTFYVLTWTEVKDAPSVAPSSGSWTALRVTLELDEPTYFMRVFGVTSMPSGARATAVHRPRDVAFVLDMTGSMGYSSQFNTGNVTGAANDNQSGNPDNLAPVFGHYVSVQNQVVATANYANTNKEAISQNNYSITTPGGPPILRNYYFDTANAAAPATSAYPVVLSQLKPAFHRWSPAESGGASPNSYDYTPVTYDFTGYDPTHTGTEASPKGPTPAPDTFGSMTDSPAGIAYYGDRYRRADGSVNKTDKTWATGTSATRAAANAVELLGYRVSGTTVQSGDGTLNVTTEDKFRDLVWEQNGYDLDVKQYRTDRGASGGPKNPSSYTAPLHPAASGNLFKGFSMGPGYWGKTFFIWPPDPRAPTKTLNPGDAGYVAGDWRRRFFKATTTTEFTPGATGIDQTLLRTSSGGSVVNGSGFVVDYPAVLKWIKSGPQVLPPNLRAGKVVYYTSIPDDVTTTTGTTEVKLDKVFWKNYIDYVIGMSTFTSATYLYGPADSWGSGVSVYGSTLNTWTGPNGFNWPSARPYMRYNDTPARPRLHFWFGPLSMADFIANSTSGNMIAGTTYEAQCWQLKAGVNSVLDDIRRNHPNDTVGLAMFSYNPTTNQPTFSAPRVAQGQDWTKLKNALFYPKSLLTTIPTNPAAEYRPYNTTFQVVANDEIPNANGNTDPNTGLMYAFNLLSPSANLPAEYGTVKGRRGASKIVIFETDGVPNSYSNFTLTSKGYDTYYSGIGGGTDSTNGNATSISRARAVVQQIVKPMAATNGTGTDSGLSLGNAKAMVYPIAFGDLFDTTLAPNATFRNTALEFLADVAADGKTGPANATTLPPTQIITGPYQTRIDNLRTCLEQIFISGLTVTLIE